MAGVLLCGEEQFQVRVERHHDLVPQGALKGEIQAGESHTEGLGAGSWRGDQLQSKPPGKRSKLREDYDRVPPFGV